MRRFGIRRSTDQDEAPVAIAAIDRPGLVDIEIDARVAERGAYGKFARTVAGDAGGGDSGDFGGWLHRARR
ncbi:MAG: hypothetical protein JWR77_1424 [Rhizorhabdus sp.]|nr:hypothetical protein [Rhizorhabdus sp.]